MFRPRHLFTSGLLAVAVPVLTATAAFAACPTTTTTGPVTTTTVAPTTTVPAPTTTATPPTPAPTTTAPVAPVSPPVTVAPSTPTTAPQCVSDDTEGTPGCSDQCLMTCQGFVATGTTPTTVIPLTSTPGVTPSSPAPATSTPTTTLAPAPTVLASTGSHTNFEIGIGIGFIVDGLATLLLGRYWRRKS